MTDLKKIRDDVGIEFIDLSATSPIVYDGAGNFSLGTVDISANTNLAVTSPIILTNDTLSLGTIDISSMTNLAVTSPIILTGDTLSLGTVDISANTNLAVTSPIVLTNDTISFSFSTNNTWTGTNHFNNAEVKITGTDTGALADKWLRIFQSSTEACYFGNYLGFTGIVNPNTNSGSIFFGISNDAGTDTDAFFLAGATDCIMSAPTSLSFNLGLFTQEMVMTSDALTFNNGSTDTYIGWGTDGRLDLGVSATSVLEITSTKVLNKQEMEIDGALNHDGTTVGFYGVTPVARPTAYTQTYSTASRTHSNITAVTLTDSTSGTTNNDIEKVSDAGFTTDNDAINNNFAEVTEEINALRVDITNIKNVLNSVIDDLQSQGLLQ